MTPAADVGSLRVTAGEWHDGQSSALCAFASSGTLLAGILAEITACIAAVAEGPAAYDPGEPSRLQALLAYADDTLPHFHIGHNTAGSPPGDPVDRFRDPNEAGRGYVEMAHDYADRDDETAWQQLCATAVPADYDCHCSHPVANHADGDAPCRTPDCGCSGFEPDYGDNSPTVRATIDAILTDGPVKLRAPHTITVTANDHQAIELWLSAVPSASCRPQPT